MARIRRVAVEAEARGLGSAAAVALREIARALDVPTADIEALARVPQDVIERGEWRPRSINIDLIVNDESRTVGESAAQRRLDEFSRKHIPKITTVTVPGLASAYRAVGRFMKETEARVEDVASPLADLGGLVRGWSDSLASDVSLAIGKIRRALRVSLLAPRDLRRLTREEQHAVLMAGQALSGAMLDAKRLMRVLRRDSRDPAEIVRDLTGQGVRAVGTFLEGLALALRRVSSADDWDTFAMHFVINARGGKKGALVTGPAITVILPTLEQVRRLGRAEVRLVPRAVLFDSPIGGLCASARGGETRARLLALSAQVAAYEHHITAGLPAWLSFDLGEDYAYGPLVSVAKSRQVLPLFVPGWELILFHPVIGRFSPPARKAAEVIATGYDDAQRWVRRVRSVSAQGAPGRCDRPSSGEDFATSQRWQHAERKLERARSAAKKAHLYLEWLRHPEDFVEAVRKRGLETLGKDAYVAPMTAYRIVRGFLVKLVEGIDRDATSLERMGREGASGRPVPRRAVRICARSLERRAEAFEFVDTVLAPLLEADPHEQTPREAAAS